MSSCFKERIQSLDFFPSVCAPQSVESIASFAHKSAQISQRLVQLSLPRLKQSNICSDLGRPEETIWTVSAPTSSSLYYLLLQFSLNE